MTNPKLETLTDTFPGLSLNSANWYIELNGGSPSGTATVSGGILSMSQPSGFCSVNAQNVYDATSSYGFIKMIPDTTDAGSDQGWGLCNSTVISGNPTFSNFYAIGVSGGNWYVMTVTGGSVTATLYSAAYNPSQHVFFRIRESGGILYYGTSPDGSGWVEPYSAAWSSSHVDVSAAALQIYADNQATSNLGTAGFADFNVAASGAGRGTAMSALSDDFPGSTLNSQWTSYGTVTVSGNEAALSSTATYSGIWSASAYDLTGSRASCKVTPFTQTGTGADGYQTVMQLSPDGTAGLAFGNNGSTSLLAEWSDASGTSTTIATATYSATSHAYLMISESFGTVTFSTSADGSTWTPFATIADSALPFSLTSLSVQLYAGHWDGGSDGTSYFSSFNTTTGGAGSRFAAVGSAFHATATTFTLVPSATGNLVLCEVISETSADYATALSSSNVTWSVLVAHQVIGSYASTVFMGEVTAASSATVTVTLSAGAPTLRIAGHEFSCSTGFASVALDTSGAVNAAAAFPSLTPAAAGELYWGFAVASSTATAGTTSGYSYAIDGNGDPSAWNPGCTSSAQAPNAGGSGTLKGVAVLLTATPVRVPGWVVQGIVPGALTVLGTYSGTLSGVDIGYVSDVYVNPDGTIADTATSVGWLTVQSYADDLTVVSQAYAGYAGETAADRLSRLCLESGIGFEVTGNPADTPQMGPQQDDTLTKVLQSCEDVDRGLLYESRDQFGLAYRTRVSMCGQSPAVVYDWSGGQIASPPPQPVTDDPYTRNSITLTRNTGSSVSVAQTAGPMSTQDPPNGAGLYTYSLTAYLYSDSQLPNMAAWMLQVGTVPDARYPQIAQDLSRAGVAALMSATAGLDHGDWVQLINPPDQLTPGPINQLVWGWTETLNNFKWQFSFNMVPESPYATGPQVLNANPGFVGSTLDGWSPFNGTITATGSPPPKPPAAFAALFTPTGSSPYGAIEGARGDAFPVTPGQGYLVSAYVYAVAGTSNVEVGVDWIDGSGSYLSTSSVMVAPTLGIWVLVRSAFYAPAGAATAVARVGRNAYPGTVADTDTMYATNIEVIWPSSTW